LLSFARALAYNPRILVMDEATSSVDSETERLIQLALDELLADRTAVVIAHRLSTIERADRIMVLGSGVLRESGTHQELLAQRGLYYRLFELQYAAMANADRQIAG
jgi:ATP-binding cassette subfamily B multidrug efflux pump